MRDKFAKLDYWARDASFGFQRIIQGQVPDGSGNPIGGPGLGDFFFLPGRSGGQIGHGDTVSGGTLTLASTAHGTKGKIYLGESQTQAAFDESLGLLGIGTVSPSAFLTLASQGSPISANPSTTVSGGDFVNETWSGNNVGLGGTGGSPNLASEIDEGFPADDGDLTPTGSFIRSNGTPTSGYSRVVVTLGQTIPSVAASYTITYRAQLDSTSSGNADPNDFFFFQLYRADGNGEVSANIPHSTLTSGVWGTFTTTITIGASPSLSGGQPNSLGVRHNAGNPCQRINISAITVTSGSTFGDLARFYVQGVLTAGIDGGAQIFGGGASAPLTLISNTLNSSTTSRIQLSSTPDIIFDIPSGSVNPLTLSLGLVSGTLTGLSLSQVMNATGGNSSTLRINNTSGSISAIPLRIDKVSGQTGHLTSWRDVSPTFTELSYIDVDGSFVGPVSGTTGIFYSTASLPALRLRDQVGATTDMLQIQDDTGSTNYLTIGEHGELFTWNASGPIYGYMRFGTQNFWEILDGSSRTMAATTATSSGANWADSSTTARFYLFDTNPNGKRVIIQNAGGTFNRLGFSSARAIIDNVASGTLATPGSMLDIANRQTSGDSLQRWIPHGSQSVDIWQLRDSGDTASSAYADSASTFHFRNVLVGSVPNTVFHVDPGSGSPLDEVFQVFDEVTGESLSIVITGAIVTSGNLSFPAGGGTVVTTTNTVSLSNKTLGTVGNTLRTVSISSGVAFEDNANTTKKLRMILSTAAAANHALQFTTTASRTWNFTDMSGNVLTDTNVLVDLDGNVMTDLDGNVLVAA